MARPREFDEERVLDAIMDSFWSKGFEATSAQDLVHATGLGRGSLYAAYSSKNGLFEQALLRYRKRAQDHAEQLLKPGSPSMRLCELMTDLVDADLGGVGKRGCLATNSAIEMAGRDPRVAELVRENFCILTRAIEEVIRKGQAAGEFRPDANPKTLALFLFNTLQGLRVLAKVTPAKDRDCLIAIIDHSLASLR